MKAIELLMDIVNQLLFMKITVFDITYTPFDLFLVTAIVGIICEAIHHFLGNKKKKKQILKSAFGLIFTSILCFFCFTYTFYNTPCN